MFFGLCVSVIAICVSVSVSVFVSVSVCLFLCLCIYVCISVSSCVVEVWMRKCQRRWQPVDKWRVSVFQLVIWETWQSRSLMLQAWRVDTPVSLHCLMDS